MWDALFGKSPAEEEPCSTAMPPPVACSVAHVVLTSATRILVGSGLYAYATSLVERHASSRAQQKWLFHVTEVCDEQGTISYVDAVTINEENAKFDRYKVVSAHMGGGSDPTFAYVLGARRNATGHKLVAGDILHALDDKAKHWRELFTLHGSDDDPLFFASALSDDPRT